MNRKDLVKYVSDKTMITISDAQIILDVFIDGVKRGLKNGDNVKIRGLGTFFLQDRKPRTALDPRNQEVIQVPAKTVVKFKASKKILSG